MNKNLFLTLSAFLFLFPLSGKATGTYRPETSVAGFIQLPGSGRQVYDFNPGWRFFKGDISGAETVNFDDRSWEVVSTPHTVELMPAEASGCRNYQGPVWYRKHFVVPAETKGQRVSIHFEGAMGKQILYLNGKRIQEHIGGYLPFTLDLTTHGVQAGDSCLLAVFADNSDDKSYPPGKRQYTLALNEVYIITIQKNISTMPRGIPDKIQLRGYLFLQVKNELTIFQYSRIYRLMNPSIFTDHLTQI